MDRVAMNKVVKLKADARKLDMILSDMKSCYKELSEVYGAEAYICGIKHGMRIIEEHLSYISECIRNAENDITGMNYAT